MRKNDVIALEREADVVTDLRDEIFGTTADHMATHKVPPTILIADERSSSPSRTHIPSL
jgi:hypothetical protein